MIFKDLKKLFKTELSKQYSDGEISELFSIFSEEILGISKFEQRLSTDLILNTEKINSFENIISELKNGRPYQQILGKTEFYGMTFLVNEYTLIPRPETEELLELTISTIKKSNFNHQKFKILDIGTGSGIIPIVLKKHFPNAEVSAVDISEKAIEIARKNATRLATNIHFLVTDYLSTELTKNYDIIISNPPYIGQDEAEEIAYSVKGFEPNNALFSPTEDALVFYKKIAIDAEKHLSENGFIFLEINQKLGEKTADLFRNKFSKTRLIKDLSQNHRFIVVEK